jgi:hypothetical protein
MRNIEEEKSQEGSALNDLLRTVVTRLNSQSTTIDQLIGTIKKLEESTGKAQIQPKVNVVVDTNPIEKIVKAGILDMKLDIAAQPKAVVKKFQLLLFPEQDARLFYKIVFSRWFMWLAIMFCSLHIYKWAIYKKDLSMQLEKGVIQNNEIVKAWQFLYNQNDKRVCRLMDSALFSVKSVIK